MSELSGKTAIITGASRGIGEAAARHLAGLGVKVVLTARSGDACEAIAGEIREAGGSAIGLGCDVADYTAVSGAVVKCTEAFSAPDILVNNAGVISPIASIAESDPAAWDTVIDINVKGVYHGIRAVLPAMLERGSGTIVTISSGAAHGPMEAWSHYCTSKAAVHMLTRNVHKEYGDKGIRAMGLSPGTVATEMQREIKASGVNPVSKLEWEDHIPADWPAKAIAWMCGPAGDAFGGEEISLRQKEIRRSVGLIA